jgi:hypothetical protein
MEKASIDSKEGALKPRSTMLIGNCINNAIINIEVWYPDAQTEGECRSSGRPAKACFGIAG